MQQVRDVSHVAFVYVKPLGSSECYCLRVTLTRGYKLRAISDYWTG